MIYFVFIKVATIPILVPHLARKPSEMNLSEWDAVYLFPLIPLSQEKIKMSNTSSGRNKKEINNLACLKETLRST